MPHLQNEVWFFKKKMFVIFTKITWFQNSIAARGVTGPGPDPRPGRVRVLDPTCRKIGSIFGSIFGKKMWCIFTGLRPFKNSPGSCCFSFHYVTIATRGGTGSGLTRTRGRVRVRVWTRTQPEPDLMIWSGFLVGFLVGFFTQFRHFSAILGPIFGKFWTIFRRKSILKY